MPASNDGGLIGTVIAIARIRDPVKILVITSFYPPFGLSGHDERCQQVVAAMAKRGHKLQVLTSNYRLPPIGRNGEVGVFRELALYDAKSLESKSEPSYRQKLREVEWNIGTMAYRLNRFQPDVIYIWNMEGLSKSLLFFLQAEGIPLVYDLHASWLKQDAFQADPWSQWWNQSKSLRSRGHRTFLQITGKARRHLRQFPMGKATDLDLSHSYVCSEYLREELAADGLPQAADLPVIYPALDRSRLVRKTEFKATGCFLWSGHLTEGKAPELGLEAVALLHAKGINVRLDIFGKGEPIERKRMRQRIDASPVADAVRMLGVRSRELALRYVEYDAFLYTGRGGDPFPITPLEAMLSGVPCLLSRNGGIAEVATDGVHALIHEPDDAEALAAALERFMALPDGGSAMAASCNEALLGQHSLDNTASLIESILMQASKSKSSPS